MLFSFIYAKPLYVLALSQIYTPKLNTMLLLLSSIFIMGSIVYIVYKYLLCIVEEFKNRKKLKPIIMLICMILFIVLVSLLEKEAQTFLDVVILPFLYIIMVIGIPIILIGIILLGNHIHKTKKIILAIVFIVITIGIYCIHYENLAITARTIIEEFQDFFTVQEINTNNHPSEYNLIYLENYKQKMEQEGFLDKYDVENILNIADNRTDMIVVHYTNGDEEIELNNVDNQLKEELGTILEGNYYKFQYEHKNDETNIYFEKYESEISENQERNNNIPYVENTGELRKIKEYQIYSTGMRIILKDDIALKKKDYTIRINRYNENLVVGEGASLNPFKERPLLKNCRILNNTWKK